MDWVFHVDTDELMYPASAAEYSLQVCSMRVRCLASLHGDPLQLVPCDMEQKN